MELLNLAGCTGPGNALNYKSYYVKHVPEDCKFAEGAKPAMRRPGEYALHAGFAGTGRHPEGPARRSLRVQEQHHRRHRAPLLDLRTRAVQRQEPPAANLLVFQDGQRATNPEWPLRVPQVLENLIGKGQMPVTIGVFVTPGNTSETYPTDLDMKNPNNRAAGVRRAERPLCAHAAGGDAAGGGQEVSSDR